MLLSSLKSISLGNLKYKGLLFHLALFWKWKRHNSNEPEHSTSRHSCGMTSQSNCANYIPWCFPNIICLLRFCFVVILQNLCWNWCDFQGQGFQFNTKKKKHSKRYQRTSVLAPRRPKITWSLAQLWVESNIYIAY